MKTFGLYSLFLSFFILFFLSLTIQEAIAQCTEGNTNTGSTQTATGMGGQSFVACDSGILQNVQIIIGGSGTPDQQVDVTIYEGDGTAGTVLGTVTGATVSQSSTLSDFQIIDLSGENISLTGGNTYTFETSSLSNILYQPTGSYEDGQMYFNGGVQSTLDLVFQVNIGASASSDVFWNDDFEDPTSPSSGTRTPSNNGGTTPTPSTAYFKRTDGSDIDLTTISDGPYSNKEGTYFWAGEDHDGPFGNPEQSIVWSGIDISGKSNISFKGLFAANSESAGWENNNLDIDPNFTHADYIIIEYSIDEGTYQELLSFYGNNEIDKQLALDTDGDKIGDGAILTKTFSEFSAEINETGSTVQIRLRAFSNNSAVEEWAIDNFQLETAGVAIATPTVTTTVESGVGTTSATLGGEVTADGGATVTESGIVWGTASSPDINSGYKVAMDAGVSSFSESVDLLPFGTTIYFRAYATNSEGTAYGSEESFSTSDAVSVNLTGTEGWRLLSIPAAVNLSTALEPIWTQGATAGADTDFGTPNVYTWDLSSPDEDVNDWNSVTDLNTTLTAGIGLLVYVYADDNYDNSADPFPKTLSLSGTEYASGTSPSLNSTANGWTLLGNPFASPIDFGQLTKNNLLSTIYVWNPNDDTGDQANQDSGSWETWNGSSGDLTGGRIAPFQGFFVENASSGSIVNFTQFSKTSTATNFLGKETQTPFVRLELQGNGMKSSAWLEFSSDGALDKTDGDAWELTPLSSHYALLATQKEDGSLLDIGRYPQSSDLTIPLVAEVTQSGRYTITITDMETSGLPLFLNDLDTQESFRLEPGMSYEFTLHQTAKAPANPLALLDNGLKKQSNSQSRFTISSAALEEQTPETPQQFSLEQNYPNPFNPVTVINYQLPVNSEVQLDVFDMAGRQVATLVNTRQTAGTYSVNFDGSNLSSGVYMYRLEASGISLTKKLTLIK